jgi:hypothetical protein
VPLPLLVAALLAAALRPAAAQLAYSYYAAAAACTGTCSSSYVNCGNTTGSQQQPRFPLLYGATTTTYAVDAVQAYKPNFAFSWFGTNYGLGGSSIIYLNANFQILFGVNSAARPNPTTPADPGAGIAFGQGVQRGSYVW